MCSFKNCFIINIPKSRLNKMCTWWHMKIGDSRLLLNLGYIHLLENKHNGKLFICMSDVSIRVWKYRHISKKIFPNCWLKKLLQSIQPPSSTFLGSGHRGRSQTREAQTSISPAASSSFSKGIPRRFLRTTKRHSPSRVSWVFLETSYRKDMLWTPH